MQTFRELRALIHSDLMRYTSSGSLKTFVYQLLFQKGFTVSFHYRITRYLYLNQNPLFSLFNLYYKWIQMLQSCELPYRTQIGEGFYFSHVIGTVISSEAIIGSHCNLSHNVTVGSKADKSGKPAYPVIGNHVYLGAGAVVVGEVQVGNNVAIGANAVVISSIPDHAIAVGVPAKPVSFHGNYPALVPSQETSSASHTE